MLCSLTNPALVGRPSTGYTSNNSVLGSLAGNYPGSSAPFPSSAFPGNVDLSSNRLNGKCIICLLVFPIGVWNQTNFRLVPNESENGKYNLILVWFNKISKHFSVCTYRLNLFLFSGGNSTTAAGESVPSPLDLNEFPTLRGSGGVVGDGLGAARHSYSSLGGHTWGGEQGSPS